MKFSPAVAICFTLNYVIGSGFLTLPWAFEQTGLIIGVVVMFVFCIFSIAAVLMILETMDRAKRVNEYICKMHPNFGNNGEGYLSVSDTSTHDNSSSIHSPFHDDNDVPIHNAGMTEETTSTSSSSSSSSSSSRKFEINEMCGMFMGKRGINYYTLAAIIFV